MALPGTQQKSIHERYRNLRCSKIWGTSVDRKSAKNSYQKRTFPLTNVKISLRSNGDPATISGYAAVFDSWSQDLGFFKEKIQRGAFSKTILENDIRALINHDPNLIIGRTKNKTLKLWEDTKGLGFNIKLPDTSYAKDLRESINREDITQMSFGFTPIQSRESANGKERTLTEVKLLDVPPVTFPAYEATKVEARDQFPKSKIQSEILKLRLKHRKIEKRLSMRRQRV